MGFLPEGASAPKENSKYLRPTEGTIKFRAVGEAVVGFEYWDNNKKPVRLKKQPSNKPDNIRLNDDGSYTIKYFWAFPVIDRNDLGGVVKVLELTQSSIMRDLEAYLTNEDWGDITGYDISITGTGKSMERRYSTIASPHKPLTADEKKTIKDNPVNLEALFLNLDPFDKTKQDIIAEVPESEITSNDQPF